MSVRLSYELNQTLLRGGQRLPHHEVQRAFAAVEHFLHPRRAWRVSVAFVSEAEIRGLNARYRGKDKVTDVLSFGDREGEHLGEVLLCYAQARRQAVQQGHTVRDENLFLLVHGLLHLFGMDHERPLDAKKMFGLQTRILESLGIDPRL